VVPRPGDRTPGEPPGGQVTFQAPRNVPEDKKVVKVQTEKLISGAILSGAILSPAVIVNQALGEALREVPRPDWIEIRVIRYDVVDKEEGNERDVTALPPGPGSDG